MPRRPRLDAPGAIHHVMNRGVDHQRVFFADQDRVEFGARLATVHERFRLETLAYCLMENHFHLLVRTPDGGLPAAMQHLGLVYTRHTNDRVGRDGPLFRGRYHSIMVTTDAYLVWAARYIHRNALDVAGVSSPATYRWSSYRSYLGHRRSPSFLRTGVVLEQFAGDRDALARFTESGDPFDGAGRPATVADLLQVVQLAIAAEDLVNGDDVRRRWILRTVLVILSELLDPGALRDELVAHLAFPTVEARAASHRRAERHWDDVVVERIVHAVLAEFPRSKQAA